MLNQNDVLAFGYFGSTIAASLGEYMPWDYDLDVVMNNVDIDRGLFHNIWKTLLDNHLENVVEQCKPLKGKIYGRTRPDAVTKSELYSADSNST